MEKIFYEDVFYPNKIKTNPFILVTMQFSFASDSHMCKDCGLYVFCQNYEANIMFNCDPSREQGSYWNS